MAILVHLNKQSDEVHIVNEQFATRLWLQLVFSQQRAKYKKRAMSDFVKTFPQMQSVSPIWSSASSSHWSPMTTSPSPLTKVFSSVR